MSTKIKLYDEGDCVEVSTWTNDETDGFFVPARMIGLVLESHLMDMDVNEGDAYTIKKNGCIELSFRMAESQKHGIMK